MLKKTKRFINKFKSDIGLFVRFVLHTDYKTYQEYSLSDDKKLYIVFIEWLLNDIGHYVFIGLLIFLALKLDSDLGLYLMCTVSYWLVFRLLSLLRTGK